MDRTTKRPRYRPRLGKRRPLWTPPEQQTATVAAERAAMAQQHPKQEAK